MGASQSFRRARAMTFHPRMTSLIDGIRPVAPLRCRVWDGAVADLWEVEGRAGGGGRYVSPDPRVVIFLDPSPPGLRVSETPAFVGGGRPAGRICFVPAEAPLWSRIAETRRFSHLDLHFDRRRLEARGAVGAALAAATRPVLLDDHAGILDLTRRMAQDCRARRLPDREADRILEAILRAVPDPLAPPAAADAELALTPAQLRRVVNRVVAAPERRASVADLAAAAGLSESWFAHAFKRTTGRSPARWATSLRLDRARVLLAGSDDPIAEIAAACGFVDQAHLTRSFRADAGLTPAAFRKAWIDG